MAPIIISGIASVANNLIDAWSNVAQQKAGVQAAKFEGAMNRALGAGQGSLPAAPTDPAALLRSKLLASPEVSSVLNTQDPAHPVSLQVSRDGRLWMQSANGMPTEVALSPESQQLAQSLAALTANNSGGAAPAGSTLYTAPVGSR